MKRRRFSLAWSRSRERQRFADRSGFTLLELIVTFSILTLLIGTGIPAFRRFGRVAQLDLAADQVKGAILETRALALNPRADKDSASANGSCLQSTDQRPQVKSYAIQFNAATATYQQLEGSCPLGPAVSLPPLIQVVPGPTAPLIAFSISCQGVVVSVANNASCGGGATTSVLTTGAGDVIVQLIHSQLETATQRTVSLNRETGAVSIRR